MRDEAWMFYYLIKNIIFLTFFFLFFICLLSKFWKDSFIHFILESTLNEDIVLTGFILE